MNGVAARLRFDPNFNPWLSYSGYMGNRSGRAMMQLWVRSNEASQLFGFSHQQR